MEDHAGRGEAAFRQDMMDQVALHSTVSVQERVDIDKAECEDRGRHDRIGVSRRTLGKCDHPIGQGCQIFMPRTDMVGQGHSRFAVVRADETALIAHS